MVAAAIAIGSGFERDLAATIGAPGAAALRDALVRIVERAGTGDVASRRVRIL